MRGAVQVPREDLEDQREALLRRTEIRPEYLDKIAALGEGKFAAETGRALNPRFVRASKTAVRVACWSSISAALAFILRAQSSLAEIYFRNLSGVIIAIIFNVTPHLASTIQNILQALLGTSCAMLVSFALYQIPAPHNPGAAGPVTVPVCPAREEAALVDENARVRDQLFDWFCVASSGLVTADTLIPGPATFVAFGFYTVFVLLILGLNVVMPFKTFALVTATNFMMHYANPHEDVSGYMDLRSDSTLVVTLVTQLAGSSMALLAMTFPPITATNTSKVIAAQVTKKTVELLVQLTEYYVGEKKTLAINVWNSQLERNREDMDQETKTLDASWWESFDWGNHGIVRYLMTDHLQMLRELDRRLTVLQICVLSEEFEDAHKELMRKSNAEVKSLIRATGDLLLNCTIAASDGYLSEDEKTQLRREIAAVEAAVRGLAARWRGECRSGGPAQALSKELRSESFFVLELSTFGRTVVDFTKVILDDDNEQRSRPTNVVLERLKKIVETEEFKTRTDFRNFVIRNWISLTLAWWWAVLANGFGPALVTNVVYMLTQHPGNSLMMNLQKLQASVLGSLAGMVLYRSLHYCTMVFKLLKLTCLFFWTLFSMFVANYSSEYQVVGLLLAVFGSVNLLAPCDDWFSNGEVVILQAKELKSLKTFTFSMCIVTAVDFIMKREPAADQARDHLRKAINMTFTHLREFLNGEIETGQEVWKSTSKRVEEVEAILDKVLELVPSASIEPRFAKGAFKAGLYKDLCERIRKFQVNIQVLVRRTQGGKSGLLRKLTQCKSWTAVRSDLMGSIEDTEKVLLLVIGYDGFQAMDPSALEDVIDKAGVGTVEDLRLLEEDLAKTVAQSESAHVETAEDDEVSRFCVIIEMIDRMEKEMAGMLVAAVRSM